MFMSLPFPHPAGFIDLPTSEPTHKMPAPAEPSAELAAARQEIAQLKKALDDKSRAIEDALQKIEELRVELRTLKAASERGPEPRLVEVTGQEIEVKRLQRNISIGESDQHDTTLTKYLSLGWEIIPSLTRAVSYNEIIYLRKQRTVTHIGIPANPINAQVEAALSTQADPSASIIMQPVNLRQQSQPIRSFDTLFQAGASVDAVKAACDQQVLDAGLQKLIEVCQ